MSQELTGILFPEVELAGVKYTLKFTREVLLYRLSRRGLDVGNLNVRLKALAAVVDFTYALIEDRFVGTADDLAQIILQENKVAVCADAIRDALGKVFPPTQAPVTAVEATALN